MEKKGFKGALSNAKSRKGLTLSFSAWPVSLENFTVYQARVLSVSYFRSGRRVGEDPRDGVELRTRRILREQADWKQSIKYLILLLMLVVLKLKYSFACFNQ